MILVDTSVWIDHLRSGVPVLSAVLYRDEVLTHPFVLGELACGNLKQRDEILSHLGELPRTRTATDAEALDFIERRNLMGWRIGYIDVHLLAAAALEAAQLWTRDKRLVAVAAEIGVGVDEADLAGEFRIHEQQAACATEPAG